jgi:3-deoxy-7-phosphoheptulonate synthase
VKVPHPERVDDWVPTSWQNKTAQQQAIYPDPAHLEQIVQTISHLPPLVTPWEVDALRAKLARAARGEVFLLHGGDCAESFDQCDPVAIAAKLKILLQMSLVLIYAAQKPVVRVGRIAGQYAKPRSAAEEVRDGIALPSYRGDLVNRSGFTEEDRTPNPELLLRGYERAALTLNYLRALADGGFADLHHPENWRLEFARNSALSSEYETIVSSVREALHFLEAVAGSDTSTRRVDLYTSHEALILHYEQAQTRQSPTHSGWYNLSTHMPWIGMRTAQVDGAHVEYARGIRNPIALKVGVNMTAEWLRELLLVLNPDNEPGRLTLIHRLGAGNVAMHLPQLIDAVRTMGQTVLWMVDPMHGNTEETADGIKTRRFDKILRELEQAFDVHESMGSVLGGVHFELTGEDVTECIGGSSGVTAEDLKRAYKSPVDPRLNYEQSLEMALLVARRLRRQRQGIPLLG